MCEQMDSILQEIFPSSEMASYLSASALKREEIRDAIAYAAIPLPQKRDLFLRLAQGRDREYFRRQAGSVEAAIREMRPKPGEFFYLRSYCYDEDGPFPEREALEPYLAWEHLLERIREYLGYFEADKRELVWFLVEKWSPDGAGRLINDYDYTVLGTEACYFSHHPSSREWYHFSTYSDLNLPVPFHPGDVVSVDCRPFAPVSHAVILEVGDNRDCCCLQALYRQADGGWDTGAVKHGYIIANRRSPGISPLYRLSSFHGQLPKEERLLEKVSRYVEGDEQRGSALWSRIFHLEEAGKQRAVTRAQLLSCMEQAAALQGDIQRA